MQLKLSLLALLPAASLTLSAIVPSDSWASLKESIKAGTYNPGPNIGPGFGPAGDKYRRAASLSSNDPGFAPRVPEILSEGDDSHLNSLLERQSTVIAGPNLANNFALIMVDAEKPDHALDFWGTEDAFYYFCLREGQIMFIDDGIDTAETSNKYYSFAGQGANEFVSVVNPADKWTMDTRTGMLARNGQRVFAWCYSALYPNGVGLQGVKGGVCEGFGLLYKRMSFRAVNKRSMLPKESGVGWYPAY